MRFIDRILKAFGLTTIRQAQPAKAARGRRAMQRTYQAALATRQTSDWSMAQTSANAELRRSLRSLRARSRDLCRNKGLFKKFLGAVVGDVVGPTGPKLRVRMK